MRGRVIPVLFLSFFVAATATPQCNYQLAYSAPYRASYFDVVADGNDLWTATGYGLQLFDRSADPPRSMDILAIPGLTRIVRVSGGVAYAGSGTSISVVRKTGSALQLIRAVEAGGTVNDLALAPGFLYAATSNGIAAFSLADPLLPVGGLTQAQTSVRNVVSIAATASELYAADNDNSVEVFSRAGATLTATRTLQGLPRSSSVRVIANLVYVSDGQRTAIFGTGAPNAITELPFGTTSVLDAGGNVIYAAGTDRQLHVLNLAVIGQPVELFETEVVPTGGTVNRVTSLALAGNRLSVAGGDAGLLTFDIASFLPPYQLGSYLLGAKNSVTSTATSVFAGDPAGGISELSRSPSGVMTFVRQWSSQPAIVHDNASGLLLTSSGNTLQYWALSPTPPALVSSSTFRSGVRSAFVSAPTAYALLEDGTVWSADLAQQNPAPVRVATPGGVLSFLSRSGNGFTVAEITDAGNSNVHFLADVNATPLTATIPGSATAMAADGRRAAVFTFRGINIVDFSQSPPAVTVLAQSNTAFVTDMSMRGNRLVDLAGETVRVWDLSSGTVTRQFTLPVAGTAVDIAADSDLIAVATSSGLVSLNLQTSSKQPALMATTGGSDYYRKAAAASRFLYLFDGRDVDIFETTSAAPHLAANINSPGLLDMAASESVLFTLSGKGTISAYSADGTFLGSASVNEGSDTVPLSIAAVRGAAWVSISKGCLSTGCEKKTLVYDAQSLVRTATLAGATIDVTTNGNRAYAIFDQPKELRVYDVADALHPSPRASRALEGDAAIVSANAGIVYALGDKLYIYSEAALTRIGEQQAGATRVLVQDTCAVTTGPASTLQWFATSPWTLQRTFELPGTAKSLVLQNGRIVILTDYSVEVWARGGVLPARRRAM